jgi:hypothetical protein
MATDANLVADVATKATTSATKSSEMAQATFGAQAQASSPGTVTAKAASATGSQVSTTAHAGASTTTAHFAAGKGASAAGSAAAKGGIVAAKASAVAKAMAVVGVGVAGLAVAAHTGVAPGITVALSHVPVWTHAHSVLGSLQNAVHGRVTGSGSSGVSL